MARWAGLDLNGWHDFAVRDWDIEDEKLATAADGHVDGGISTVVVKSAIAGVWIGGPQAVLAPHGRGKGWGAVGDPKHRQSLRKVFELVCQGGKSDELERKDVVTAFTAAADALTVGADKLMVAIPDQKEFNEAVRDRILGALRGQRRPQPTLLWRSVALFQAALKIGTIPKIKNKLNVRVLIHSDAGLECQHFELAEATGFPGHFAPIRNGYGSIILRGFGLDSYFIEAEALVRKNNPVLEESGIENSRLPAELVFSNRDGNEDEILRLQNGTWTTVQRPIFPSKKFGIPSGEFEDLPKADLTIFSTPLRDELAVHLSNALQAYLGEVERLPWESVADGALYCGRLIEKGLPHYLDRLETISLAVMKADGPAFEYLIPPLSNVPANKEYVSAPMTGFQWGKDKTEIEFYVLKGEREIRNWQATKDAGPKSPVAVILQLRQMPGQSWAKLEVTSPEWEELSRSPIFLDWEILKPVPETPQEILENLKWPDPVIPIRIVEPAHVSMWNGELQNPGLEKIMSKDPDTIRKALSAKRRPFFQDGERINDNQSYRAIDTDGNFPAGLKSNVAWDFDLRMTALENQFFLDLKRNKLRDNKLLLCLSWAFTRCPEAIQNTLLEMLEAHANRKTHPLFTVKGVLNISHQSAGRSIDGVAKIRRLLLALLDSPAKNNNTLAAFAFILSRREKFPEAVDLNLINRIAEFMLLQLKDLHATNSFRVKLKNVLMATTGLLRYREKEPRALVSRDSKIAERLVALLKDIKTAIEHQRKTVTQADQKIATIENLLELLAGTGGDPNILVRIDNLEGDDGGDGGSESADDLGLQ